LITVPSVLTLKHARLYRDSHDAQLIYCDVLQPAPMKGDSATRWMPIPGSDAYLVGEVRFGPGNEGFGEVPQLVEHQRLLPMPWEIAQVYAWYRRDDGAEIVARGKTSGFGPSNAVFNGSAPLSAMISPVLVSADLVCRASLVGASVSGKGTAGAVESALVKSALGPKAAWDASLGEVLVNVLSGLLETGDLTLQITAGSVPPGSSASQAELRELALLEWAHRIQALLWPEQTLAVPAAVVTSMNLPDSLVLDLAWSAGSSVTLRAVRVLRPREMGRSVPRP
jgi:hypothetical protein